MSSYLPMYVTSGISHTFADTRGALKATTQRGSSTTADIIIVGHEGMWSHMTMLTSGAQTADWQTHPNLTCENNTQHMC